MNIGWFELFKNLLNHLAGDQPITFSGNFVIFILTN